LTPIELDYAFKTYIEEIKYKEQLSWEQLRTDVYYRYLMLPREKGQRPMSYAKFKKNVFPLDFDKETPDEEVDINQIIDVFNSLENAETKSVKSVSAEELNKLNI